LENTAKQLGTLETEGHALARAWRSRDKVERSQFVFDSENVPSFDSSLKRPKGLLVRTGAIMVAISEDKTTLMKSGLNKVDKRRRSECKWFFENLKECQAFIAQSKKGYGNLSALQRAMKPKAEPKVEDKSTDDSEASISEVGGSDVGPSQLPTTKFDLAKEIMKTCLANNIDPIELIELVKINHENSSIKVVPVGKIQASSFSKDSGWKVIENV
jgi:hypothetical protein